MNRIIAPSLYEKVIENVCLSEILELCILIIITNIIYRIYKTLLELQETYQFFIPLMKNKDLEFIICSFGIMASSIISMKSKANYSRGWAKRVAIFSDRNFTESLKIYILFEISEIFWILRIINCFWIDHLLSHIYIVLFDFKALTLASVYHK